VGFRLRGRIEEIALVRVTLQLDTRLLTSFEHAMQLASVGAPGYCQQVTKRGIASLRETT